MANLGEITLRLLRLGSTTPGSAQGFSLAPHSGITPCGVRGDPHAVPRMELGSTMSKASALDKARAYSLVVCEFGYSGHHLTGHMPRKCDPSTWFNTGGQTHRHSHQVRTTLTAAPPVPHIPWQLIGPDDLAQTRGKATTAARWSEVLVPDAVAVWTICDVKG